MVITWSRFAGMKFCTILTDSFINSSKNISCDYMWNVSSWLGRIPLLFCRVPLGGTKFIHRAASVRLSGKKKLMKTSAWRNPSEYMSSFTRISSSFHFMKKEKTQLQTKQLKQKIFKFMGFCKLTCLRRKITEIERNCIQI